MQFICVAIQKGGSAKTTLATTLATTLQERGKKVLLVDTDQQCNATDIYAAQTDGVYTIYDIVVKQDCNDINQAIQHTELGDIIPSDRLMVNAETVLKGDAVNGNYRLKDALENLQEYEYVIFDTNPALNSMLINCLVCSDIVLIPCTADRFGITALSQLNDTLMAVKKRLNPNLEVGGIVISRVKKNTNLVKLRGETLKQIAEALHTRVFKTMIRDSISVQNAQDHQSTVTEFDKRSIAAQDYEALCDEFLEVMEDK